jgi:hypothetical protein
LDGGDGLNKREGQKILKNIAKFITMEEPADYF